jgi:hypothetical protein
LAASRPDRGRNARPLLGALLIGGALAPAANAQVEARPALEGTAFLGDEALPDGIVVLHHISEGSQGELDSMRLGPDGSFRFELPQVPDPARRDVFFASVRHDGVLYFGPAITRVLELDSIYEIHAYDTLLAPPEGVALVMEARSLFLEPDSGGVWRATDLFQVRNDGDRTVVARSDGHTWSYPLPPGARDVMAGEGETSLDVARYEGGALIVSAALPPGQRLFVARYRLDSPYIAFPTPGVTEALDVLVREPGPPLEIEGLEAADRVDLEGGGTFLRYAAVDYAEPFVELVQGEEVGAPPVEWMAVILAMLLTAGGVLAILGGRRTPAPASVPVPVPGRRELMVEVARLDEDFEALAEPSAAQTSAYRRRRAELMRRLRSEV